MCEGRVIVLSGAIDREHVIFANAHIVPAERSRLQTVKDTWKEIQKLANSQTKIVMGGGDFNEASLSERANSETNIEEKECIAEFLLEKEFCDVWKLFNPDKKRFTFWRMNKAARLDSFFVNENFLQHVQSADILTKIVGDHARPQMETLWSARKRKSALWGFQKILLQEPDFTKSLEKDIERVQKENETANPDIIWELCKIKNAAAQNSVQIFERIKDENYF